MAKETKLKVQDLTISFKTASGKLQAVRGINFDLYKGETLAIVGESGSGKSVTSRAIMGILAGNAIVEGGKILYGDKDLMKISEEEFHRIRGDKIAMVFQDPLSSLNPIMRVGNQLTEAMLLKNKASRRENKKAMNEMFSNIEKFMTAAGDGESGKADIATFRKFEEKHCELEQEYQQSLAYAESSANLAENMVLRIQNKAFNGIKEDTAEVCANAKKACSYFVVRAEEARLQELVIHIIVNEKEGRKTKDYSAMLPQLEELQKILRNALAYEKPDTFSIGYYLTYVDKNVPDMPVAQLNALAAEKLNTQFMDSFLQKMEHAVKLSIEQTDAHRKEAIAEIDKAIPVLKGKLEKNSANAVAKQLKDKIVLCLNPLEVTKDSLTHTFDTSIDYALNLYFDGIEKNKVEEKRYKSQKAKYDKIAAKGKAPEWEVIPASYVDLEVAQQDIVGIVAEMKPHFEQQLENNRTGDLHKRTMEIVDYLKECAAESVYKISKSMAKERAIKLMASVGIDEPRRRYSQYPFEFSGGMRQRIVIAIALTANPDVLICDEPTTALDVTIQAQILELINNLKKERDLSVIFITHDLGVVANMADRIGVMYAGKIVEYGTAEDIFYAPAHPYTWALLSSVPDLNTVETLESIPGTPPNMIYPPKGDAFADRNKYALEIDFEMQPPMFKITDSHYAATWLLHPDAPKIELPLIIRNRIAKMESNKKAEEQQ